MTLAIAITGTPGVGKSTVCATLAKRLPVAAHVEADQLQQFLVSGGQWPSTGTRIAADQLVLRTRNAATIAANFVAAGVPVFIDEVICTREQLAVLAEALPNLRIIGLTATANVVLQRDAGRSKQTAKNYRHVASQIAQALGDETDWIDTTEMNLEETVAEVWRVLTP